MPLAQLEYYREITLNGRKFRTEDIAGEIGIQNDRNKISTCTFSLYNDLEVPVIVNPYKDARSMVGQTVEIIAGYHRGFEQKRRVFFGRITNAGMSYPEDGKVIVNFECYSYGFSMNRATKNEIYPVVSRETTPAKDSRGVTARSSLKSDVRSWAVLKTGQTISLEEIIRNIITDNEIEEGQILVDNITYDGLNSELHQVDKTDWQFLQELADRFACSMYIDQDSGLFYFIKKTALRNEKIVNQDNQEIEDRVEFYFHRSDPNNPRVLAPRDRMDPVLENATLPMINISYNFDLQQIKGGFITQTTDLDGNLSFNSTIVNEDGEISYEKLVIRKELLETPAADEFIRNYKVGETTWEETKQFWKTEGVKVKDYSDTRENPPVYPGEPNLEFETWGCVHIVPMRKYKVHNMGFRPSVDGDDVLEALCVGTELALGDVFMIKVKMIAF